MEKKIPSTMHGALDYTTAGTLFALPRLLGLRGDSARFMTLAAIGTLAYSLMTRYELGVVKKLPMPMHLTLDKMNGAMFVLSPVLMPRQRADAKLLMVGIGLFELAVAMMSKSKTSYDQPKPRILHDVVERTRQLVGEPIWKR